MILRKTTKTKEEEENKTKGKGRFDRNEEERGRVRPRRFWPAASRAFRGASIFSTGATGRTHTHTKRKAYARSHTASLS